MKNNAYRQITDTLRESNGHKKGIFHYSPTHQIEFWQIEVTIIWVEVFFQRDEIIGVEVYVSLTPENNLPLTIDLLKQYIKELDHVSSQ